MAQAASFRVGALNGAALLSDPTLNKGTAFSIEERDEFQLHGLLPPRVEGIADQLARAQDEYDRQTTDLQRYEYLRGLQDENETLFYAFLLEDLPGRMPIVYTPVVGDACERFSHIYRHPRGLFISYPDADRMEEMLRNAPREGVEVIVVTDGERILGLGDLGANGMGIPIGKLSLYSACGGIDPRRTLPIILDVGTNTAEKRDDPEYIGWRHERITGDDYDAFVDRFVQGVKKVFPDVLLQFEDFAQRHAHKLLDRYRDQLCTFNDDIQGTASVTLAAILSAVRMSGGALADQRVVIAGAGSAGTGIAELIIQAMVDAGVSEADARGSMFVVDRRGLLVEGMDELLPFQVPLCQKQAAVADFPRSEPPAISLADTVAAVKPTILIGVTGAPGLFHEQVIRTMAAGVERPIVFPLSNPTSRVEAQPSDLLAWTDGKALIGTGSPFGTIEHGGTSYAIAQCNNSYVFPAMGLGIRASGAQRVSDTMFMAASKALASFAAPDAPLGASILPDLKRIREVARAIAVAVAKQAQLEGLVPERSDAELEALVDDQVWSPVYPAYVR